MSVKLESTEEDTKLTVEMVECVENGDDSDGIISKDELDTSSLAYSLVSVKEAELWDLKAVKVKSDEQDDNVHAVVDGEDIQQEEECKSTHEQVSEMGCKHGQFQEHLFMIGISASSVALLPGLILVTSEDTAKAGIIILCIAVVLLCLCGFGIYTYINRLDRNRCKFKQGAIESCKQIRSCIQWIMFSGFYSIFLLTIFGSLAVKDGEAQTAVIFFAPVLLMLCLCGFGMYRNHLLSKKLKLLREDASKNDTVV
eukprot:Nk52_evm26s1485 gene=Nk52_evmTU26s1485